MTGNTSNHVRHGMIRSRKALSLILLLLLISLTIYYLHPTSQHVPNAILGEDEDGNEKVPATSTSHPIHQLISKNEADFKALKARQSKTLSEAVTEYRRRYGIPPPPNFDKWYAFATKRKVQLIDEFDTIHEQLTPFWALEPAVIRERARESIGFDNALIAVLIRNGKVTHMEGGGDMYAWHREATPKMLASFLKYLPDMDLAFNIHDEPRIVMQHDDLARHVNIALTQNMPKISPQLSNTFSPRPADMNTGDRVKEFKTTRFNRYAHQGTWYDSRLSCSAESAARRFINDHPTDDSYLYTTTLGFLTNTTSFSDICNTPSLRHSFGFFDRPNAFDVAHELFPVFSQSKVSSFQDILYPSPWYYMGRVRYEPDRDMPFSSKNATLYWRGSTTGGFSRDGGWRNQHRQRFVNKTITGTASYLKNTNPTDSTSELWVEQSAPISQFSHLFDVHFTHFGQCDPGDCDAQRAYFETAPHVNMFDALQSKYLLDIDGNAFSGRYYAWLLSHSLVYKFALFREWHDEIMKPWVHYVPLGIEGTEYVEAVRFFEEEGNGQMLAERLAEEGREWAEKSLRNDDLEVYYFRLLLEYGRLIDDGRYEIGFDGS